MHEFCFGLNWAGMKPEVWAAWAQAVLSVIAICFAGWFSLQQHRRELWQRVSVTISTVGLAAATVLVNEAYLKKWQQTGKPITTDLPYLEYLTKALRETPLHDLADGRLLHIVAGSASFSQKSADLLREQLLNNPDLHPPTQALLDEFHKYVVRTQGFLRQADNVGLDYERRLVFFPLPGYWMWRSKKARRDAAPDIPEVTLG